MLIETNPCENCDLCPLVCGVDVEMCQIARRPLGMDREVWEEIGEEE